MARSNEEQGRQVGSMVDNLKDSAVEMGHNISDAAREKYGEVRDQASQYYKMGRDKASELEDGVETFIKEKPVQALLIAAGVGLLVGLMWRRH